MPKGQRHILALRFSALGDVAMTSPVLKLYAQANPEVKFTIAAPKMLEPLFKGYDNLHFCAVDKKSGLLNIFRQLKALHPTDIADLHSVLRTFALRTLFAFCGKKVTFLKKGRSSKRAITRQRGKRLEQLSPMVERYSLVLQKLKLKKPQLPQGYICVKSKVSNVTNVGIAPFAKHKGKRLPIETVEKLIEQLTSSNSYNITLFGGGKVELEQMQKWVEHYPQCTIASFPGHFEKELEALASLDVLISMDSANTHFASCMETPVISIWGATHPYTGFYPWRQDPKLAVQSNMECRPCSVFGNKPCINGDYKCLYSITTQDIIDKINYLFNR